MPRKKLTKAQVKKTIVQMGKLNAKLFTDKISNLESSVPMSMPKLLELDKILTSSLKRVK